MLLLRSVYSEAPSESSSREQNHATLLVTWWCTGMALAFILVRLWGRFIRTESLFMEDKVMALSIIPLFIRMSLIHVVMLYGTNNVDLADVSPSQYNEREIGSRLVLGARVFYAAFIWMAKYTMSEFLKRMTSSFWKRKYEIQLRAIQIYLLATFVAVVISTIGECQPITHYWQVAPDPGPQCRQGFAQLITMGVADITTDILLIIFPIPIFIKSKGMPLKRKISLVLLFSLSIVLIGITAARVPLVIMHQGRQQYRTVFASGEIMAASAISNAIILGSFLRDRGVKKAKYKKSSVSETMSRHSSRRPTVAQLAWGSDEDLVRDMGYRLDPDLHERESVPRPAPTYARAERESASFSDKSWQFPSKTDSSRGSDDTDLKFQAVEDPNPSPMEVRLPQKKNVSFFDIGGLLEEGPSPTATVRKDSSAGVSRLSKAPSEVSGTGTSIQDFASSRSSGSRALLSDMSALLPRQQRQRESSIYTAAEGESYELTPRNNSLADLPGSVPPTTASSPSPRTNTPHRSDLLSFGDAGGLLGTNTTVEPSPNRAPRPSNGSTILPRDARPESSVNRDILDLLRSGPDDAITSAPPYRRGSSPHYIRGPFATGRRSAQSPHRIRRESNGPQGGDLMDVGGLLK